MTSGGTPTNHIRIPDTPPATVIVVGESPYLRIIDSYRMKNIPDPGTSNVDQVYLSFKDRTLYLRQCRFIAVQQSLLAKWEIFTNTEHFFFKTSKKPLSPVTRVPRKTDLIPPSLYVFFITSIGPLYFPSLLPLSVCICEF